MARTAITVTELNGNADTSDPSGTAVGATNDGSVSGYPLEEIVLRVEVGSATTATIKAGANPPSLSAGQGDYATSIATTESPLWLGPFEGARFEQGSNVLHIDVSGTCTVSAFHIPRNF